MLLSVYYYMPKVCKTGPKIFCLGIIHIFFKTIDRVMGKQEKEEADNKIICKVRRLGGRERPVLA